MSGPKGKMSPGQWGNKHCIFPSLQARDGAQDGILCSGVQTGVSFTLATIGPQGTGLLLKTGRNSSFTKRFYLVAALTKSSKEPLVKVVIIFTVSKTPNNHLKSYCWDINHYLTSWIIFVPKYKLLRGFPGSVSGKELSCQCRRNKRWEFDPWVGKILWRRKCQPIPIFLYWESPWTEDP